MQAAARLSAATELLETIYEGWQAGKRAPADALLSDYYKSRRYMGSKDRGFVSQLIYFILRHGGALQWWLEQAGFRHVTPRQVVLAALVLDGHYDAENLIRLCDGKRHNPEPLNSDEEHLVRFCEDKPLYPAEMPEWARFNLPDWTLNQLKEHLGDEFAEAIEALNQEAPVDLRVNTLKCPERSDLIMELDRYKFYGAPTRHSTLGIRLKKRLPIYTIDAFRNGWFEMQDEGSQIVAALAEAKSGEKVIDFCAGAGGKTLALAAQMENKGRLLAWDVNENRLGQMKKRLRRAGVDNVITHVLSSENDSFIKRHIDSADCVLVDAPCSGSGTWRRNPDLKWRFGAEDMEEMCALQASILKSASRTVRPGGRLVYATCSLLPQENALQVKKFLEESPDFRIAEPAEEYRSLAQEVAGVGPVIQLMPHKHETDGFFAAILQRL
jgi:16S rRNA (cytosine967-C5)-methyltransferase